MSEEANNIRSSYKSAAAAFAKRHNLEQVAADISALTGTKLSAGVLRNKFNRISRHNLTGDDLINLYVVTGDDTILDGLLFDCGLNAVRIRPSDDATPAPIRALNATAAIAGTTAMAAAVLNGERLTQSKRDAVFGGLMAGVEYLVQLATEVEEKFHAVPSLACAADMARAALGA